jgi:hypothetical protein
MSMLYHEDNDFKHLANSPLHLPPTGLSFVKSKPTSHWLISYICYHAKAFSLICFTQFLILSELRAGWQSSSISNPRN